LYKMLWVYVTCGQVIRLSLLQAAEMQLEEEKKKSFAEAELLKQNIERLEKELLESQRANVTSSIEHADEDEPAVSHLELQIVYVV